MSAAEFAAYVADMVPAYAEAGARATGMALDAAMVHAKSQIDDLLPDGSRTEGHHFLVITDEEEMRAGVLWCAERRDRDEPDLFVYDVIIDEARRGMGLGTAAMEVLERLARELELPAIALHVFADNEGAVRLYERIGYACTHRGPGGLQMRKDLGEPPGARPDGAPQ